MGGFRVVNFPISFLQLSQNIYFVLTMFVSDFSSCLGRDRWVFGWWRNMKYFISCLLFTFDVYENFFDTFFLHFYFHGWFDLVLDGGWIACVCMYVWVSRNWYFRFWNIAPSSYSIFPIFFMYLYSISFWSNIWFYGNVRRVRRRIFSMKLAQVIRNWFDLFFINRNY